MAVSTIVIVISAAAALAWLLRARWIPHVTAARLKRRTDEDVFFDAYAAPLPPAETKRIQQGRRRNTARFCRED